MKKEQKVKSVSRLLISGCMGMLLLTFLWSCKKYDYTGEYAEGMAVVVSNDKYGFIDEKGNEVIPLKYDYAEDFSEGMAEVRLDGKCGFVDKTGKEVISLKYDYFIEDFSDGIAKVTLDKKYGFIDKAGKEVIPVKYDKIENFSEGIAKVTLNRKYGFVDKAGKEVIPVKYNKIENFSDGIAKVTLYNKEDRAGEEVTPVKYNEIDDFIEDVTNVNKKYGFIDRAGKEVIPVKYDYIEEFIDGFAKVKSNGKIFRLDKQGKEYPPIASHVLQITDYNRSANKFSFIDTGTGQKLSYRKLILSGMAVVQTKCVVNNGTEMVEFLLVAPELRSTRQEGSTTVREYSGSKSTSYSIGFDIGGYTLENGVLTINSRK